MSDEAKFLSEVAERADKSGQPVKAMLMRQEAWLADEPIIPEPPQAKK